MKFANNGDQTNPKTFAIFFAKPNFEGESQEVTAGGYDRKQLDLKDVRSFKLAEGYKLRLYASANRDGAASIIGEDISDINAVLDFTPQSFAIVSGSGALSDDELELVVGGASVCEQNTCAKLTCGENLKCGTFICGADDVECLVDMFNK